MRFIQKPWKNDRRSRNFSHSRFFGTVTQFPPSLNRPRIIPLNQGESLRCAAYAAAANGQYIHGQSFSPDWQTDKISRLQGSPVDTGGSDPNAAMNSQLYTRSGGYLPIQDWDVPRPEHDTEAENYGDAGYVRPDGQEIFDAIRAALLLAYDSKTGRGACVQAFSPWYSEWMGPYITVAKTPLGGHSYLFIDWTTENGVDYLIVQNSYGLNIGDQGFHKMSRDIVNQIFSKRGMSIKIVKPLSMDEIKLARQETVYGKLQRMILQCWDALVEKFYAYNG